MEKKNRIIFVIEQRGGLDAFLPVIEKLKGEDFCVGLILEKKNAKKLYCPRGIKLIILDKPSLETIERVINKEKPSVIFTDTNDTDFDHSITKKAVRAGKEKSIPTLGLVDYWANYKYRFNKKFIFLPDYILAVDGKMADDLAKELEISRSRVVVLGSPRFERLSTVKRKSKKDDSLAVFFSQPFSSNSCEGEGEVKVFSDIVDALEKDGHIRKIVIKFHPTREKKTKKYDKIIKKSQLKFEKDMDSDSLQLALKSGIIAGMSSMSLFDAALLRKRVLSYQPGKSKKNDTLMSNVLGFSDAVYKKEGLFRAVKKLYSKKKTNRKKDFLKEYIKNNSSGKIINFMKKITKKKEIICVVQARTGSSRLPKKVLFEIAGKPVLLHVVDRLLRSKKIDHIIVATTTKKRDDPIVRLIKGYHQKVSFFRGSEEDVLDRFYHAVKQYKPKGVMRITADCPLIDPEIVDKVVDEFLKFKVDYVSNTLGVRTYPRGLDAEIFSFKLLEELWKETLWSTDREHVTLFARRSPTLFNCRRVFNDKDYSFYRWTLDEASDYKLIKIIYRELYRKNKNFDMNDAVDLFKKFPNLIKINQDVEQKDPHF